VNVFITNSDGPNFSVNNVTQLRCHDSNDGSVSVSVSGGLAPYEISWFDNGTPSSKTGLSVSGLASGSYTVQAKDVDGCVGFRTIPVPSPPPLTSSQQVSHPVCLGSVDGTITVVASGGNGGYTYAWNHGPTQGALTNLAAGAYKVTMKDSKSCQIDREFKLIDPPPVVVTLGPDKTICVGQRVTISPGHAGSTFTWTSSNGFTSNTGQVILSQGGTYKLVVTTPLGCKGEDEIAIETSTDLLKADFLMTDEVHAGDTVVLIDISWPIPERISWDFPEDATVIFKDNEFAQIVFEDAGTYSIKLNTFLGECVDEFAHQLKVLGGRVNEGGRTANRLIETFEVHPNPSDGRFTVSAQFNELATSRLTMVHISGNKVLTVSFDNESDIAYEAELNNLIAGVYFIVRTNQIFVRDALHLRYPTGKEFTF
jgi:hypothetical protein